MPGHIITSEQFENLLISGVPFLDVRAEIAFSKGSFPTSTNIPILQDYERQVVGTCYKKNGRKAAIELAHSLINGPTKVQRIEAWCEFARANQNVHIYCWRGGMRSKYAHDWILGSGINIPLIDGGFKALRHVIIDQITDAANHVPFVRIGGKTGTAKTDLVNAIEFSTDLEGHANHRGSSFGQRVSGVPTQINFENSLGIDLLRKRQTFPRRTLVVEDESIVAKDIQLSLKRLGYNVLGIANNGEDAVALSRDLNPDIIIMDIMLKGKINGIEASEHIRKEQNIPIIFLTAYADENTLSKAKITEPYAYIIKPYKEIDLHTSIEMALYKHGKELEILKERDMLYNIVENKDNAEYIFVKSKSRLIKLNTNDVLFIEALKDYVVINTSTTRYTIHSTMKDIQKKMPEDKFLRVHRSYIVNLNKISEIESPNLILEDNNKIIPIGGSFKEDLLSKINLI